MPTTPRKRWVKRASIAFLVLLAFLLFRRGLLVTLLGLKILGYTDGLDAWKGAVRHQTVEHQGMPIDIYGEPSDLPILIVHGVNPTGKNSVDLVRISEGLAQVGYQVFVPDLAEMRKQHLRPEEAARVKVAFQFIGRDAAIACFSYGCGPAFIAAADPDIRSHVRFALAFGGYFDIRDVLEFVITGPKSPIAYLKWVYLGANSDVVDDEGDRVRLRTIADHYLQESPSNPDLTASLSAEGKAFLHIFSASSPEDFRARLNDGPEGLRQRLDALSPSRVVGQVQAPLILVHGINDPAVPAEQAIKFAEAARARGLSCRLTLLRMYGHTQPILPGFGWTSLFDFYVPETVRFLGVVNRVVSEM